MRWNRYRRDRQIIAAVLVFTVIVAAGIAPAARLSSPQLPDDGDKQLVSILTPLLNGARGQVAAALITPQGVRYGLWGSEYTTQYEIASLSKTMTASLLLEAIRRGEVTAQTPVSALVPEIVSPVRDVTLEQLVSHRSGLPPAHRVGWAAAGYSERYCPAAESLALRSTRADRDDEPGHPAADEMV
ncbi:serine hydrolase [Klebsiella variicola subsp. variicola]|nr:serine hydrolase [Klebsiella variicola subsp. variicola]